jgi:cytochrome c biogenesis protein CcmG, thiol:disulfide interchange protein DsbE
MSVTGRVLRWAGLAIVGVTVVLAVVLASRFGSDPGLVDSPLIGRPAPEFTLAGLDGSEGASLSDLHGDIVVVNFFASWCLECRNEHDDLVAASESFADQDVTFVQVAYQEEAAESLDYLGEAGASETTLYLADPGSRTAIAYGVYGIPETFFIDPDGRVVGKIIGEADALILGATIDSIRRGEQPGQQITGDTQQRPDA